MKVNFEISQDERKRILEMHQTATKNLYLTEQVAKEYIVGTDKTQQPNSALTSKGLNAGKQENIYYKSTTGQIVNQSLKGDKSNFLSVFQPSLEDGVEKNYFDYLEVGDSVMSGNTKGASEPITIDFSKPNDVYATHNGLLLIWRAMVQMNEAQKPIFVKAIFGTSKTEEGMSGERETKSTEMNLKNAKNPNWNGIFSDLVTLSNNPYDLSKTNEERFKTLANYTKETAVDFMNRLVGSSVQGIDQFGFVSPKHKNEAVKLPGWVTNIDYDFSNIVGQLKSIQEESDFDDEGKFNEQKAEKVQGIIDTAINEISEKLKDGFLTNVDLYVKKFLPTQGQKIYSEVYNEFKPILNRDIKTGFFFPYRKKSAGILPVPGATDVETKKQPHKRGQ